MEPGALIDAFETEADGFAAAAERGLDPAVPTCPDWDVAELALHLGSIHRWARLAIRSTDLLPPPPRQRPDVERTALVPWFRDGAAAFAGEMRGADPESAVWTWAGPATPVWWMRRQALETAVHRVDSELAHGAAGDLAPALAVAGLEEMFDAWVTRYGGTGEDAERTMHLHATDVPAEWLVRLRHDGMSATPEHAKGDVALRGSASDLYLWLWNRAPIERLEVLGDSAVAATWTRTARF